MPQDEIKYEILEDGTISIQTSAVSGTNHMSADELLDRIADMAGGVRETTKRPRDQIHGLTGLGHEHDHHHTL